MHTIKNIINNQKDYKELILKWLNNSFTESKKILIGIKSEDDYIKAEVNKLKLRLKKGVYIKEFDRLFFMHPNRNENFYVWWDVQTQEAIILNYGKKQK